MRAMIVDDERLARNELRRLLAAIPELEIVGEAKNADEAVDQVRRLRPALLFLDIRMPDGDGFDVLERLDETPAVIFTTAFDHYALRAFEVSALDYLVKPIEPARLAAAIAKAARAIEPAGPSLAAPGRRIFVRDGDHCWFVALEDIELIESEGNYVVLHFDGHRATAARSLAALEARLDPARFFRANRSQIINLDRIASIAPWPNDGYLVRMRGGFEVEMSRRQARRFDLATRL